MTDAGSDYLNRLREIIGRHGWAVQHIVPTDQADLPYSYTVGLASAGLPELVTVGLATAAAQHYLNHFAGMSLATDLVPDTRYTVDQAGTPLTWQIGTVSETNAKSLLRLAHTMHGEPVQALQLIWPTASGLLPGDPGHQPAPSQPLLA